MDLFFERAIDNVARHGDTDIFPFPVENHVFFDSKRETVALLREIHNNFERWLATYPPEHEGALTPVSYVGFRWANQLDPLWNLYFLALVLSIADSIEGQRIPTRDQCIFSYRYKWNDAASDIFDPTYSWRAFMEHSLQSARQHRFVVTCDISEFYPRIGHHRLENALAHLGVQSDTPWRIMQFLKNFSGSASYGLPIGGPAARLLSELVLHQIDDLLRLERVQFCRYADDFHLFTGTVEEGYAKLLFLSEKLQRTQGLQLQKAKTRLMSSAEFVATSPIRDDDHDRLSREGTDAGFQEKARSLMRFSLRFDPYSATRLEDYEGLKREVEKFDLIGLLQAELSKSRIHIALARKIVTTLRYLNSSQRDQAIISIVENADLLYPIFATVLLVARQVFEELSESTQAAVINLVVQLVRSGSHVLRVELNLAYAVRLLACRPSASVQETLVALHNSPSHTPLVRRDIILAMARSGGWPWLSDRRASFRAMSHAERRAFLIASYTLKDEGKHWRHHIGEELSPFEKLIRDWAAARKSRPGWVIPL